MRIAVTYEDGCIFQHFGHTDRFKVYDIQDGRVVTATTINTNGSGHGALADILHKLDVDTLICGGIGGGAQRALSEVGIDLFAGVKGSADDAVEALLAGSLQQNTEANCDHHGHGEVHQCSSQGCVSGHCGH
ncbi:MAG: NifB/NifX family molybdenum-iron cluster-binding protein [Eubacterium aggregans]